MSKEEDIQAALILHGVRESFINVLKENVSQRYEIFDQGLIESISLKKTDVTMVDDIISQMNSLLRKLRETEQLASDAIKSLEDFLDDMSEGIGENEMEVAKKIYDQFIRTRNGGE